MKKNNRNRQYTLNFTEEEAELIEKYAKADRRKPREWLYLLVSDLLQAKKEKGIYYDKATGFHNLDI